MKKIYKKIKKNWLKLKEKLPKIAIFAVLVFELAFPHLTLAQEVSAMATSGELNELSPVLTNTLPAAGDREPTRVIWVTVTAYSSTPDQTDSDPCTTANGLNVCERNTEDVIAANFLRFGTKVKMPDVFGDQIFIVQDRMNPRYQERVDIWMKDRASAIKFGVKRVKLEIY